MGVEILAPSSDFERVKSTLVSVSENTKKYSTPQRIIELLALTIIRRPTRIVNSLIEYECTGLANVL